MRSRPFPVHPLLFAAYPILFLYSLNLGEVDLAEVAPILVLVIGLATAALALGTLVTRSAQRAALVVSVLGLSLLAYGHVAGIVEPLGARGWMEQAGWAALVGLAALGAVRLGAGHLASLTRALNLVSGLLVIVALVVIVPRDLAALTRTSADPAASPLEGTSSGGRDIVFLVFDRYGSQRSLELQYGIDDTPFQDWLRDRDFIVATDSHANYVKTSLSIAATLNLDYLDDIVAAQGPGSDDHDPVFERLADHEVGRFLLGHGYDYVHLGSYFGATKTSPLATTNLSPDSPSDFAAAVYDLSALPAISLRLGLTRSTPLRDRQYEVGRFQLDALDRLAAADPARPTFTFGHLLLPHPPYVFDATGGFVDDDADGKRGGRERFESQLRFLQSRLMTIVDNWLARPEAERPIIVLQADEGPYPARFARDTATFDWSTATADELEIKYGILNAMFLPGVDPAEVAPSISAVNTFRLVLDAYFGANLPILPDRSFTSATKFRPYDLTDITDRLPSLAGGS